MFEQTIAASYAIIPTASKLLLAKDITDVVATESKSDSYDDDDGEGRTTTMQPRSCWKKRPSPASPGCIARVYCSACFVFNEAKLFETVCATRASRYSCTSLLAESPIWDSV